MPVPAPGPGHLTASAAVPTQAAYPTGTAPSVHVQTSQQFGVFQGNWPVARPAMLSGSYVPGSYGPMILPAGVLPVPGWTPYPVGATKTVMCLIRSSFSTSQLYVNCWSTMYRLLLVLWQTQVLNQQLVQPQFMG